MSELLFEIGTEEIPAGYIQPALRFLEGRAKRHFEELGLKFGTVRTLGTPRRLALTVQDLQERQPDRVLEHTGPSKQAGFDEQGNPSRAAIGFARSRGVAVEELQVTATRKGEYLVAVEHLTGRSTMELLPDCLTTLVKEMVFPKSMRWGQGDFVFVRPIQWLLAMLDGKVIELTINNVPAGATTRGHRFMAPVVIPVSDAESYVNGLREHSVIVDIDERRAAVVREVKTVVEQWSGEEPAVPILDEELVDTVTNLVEIPWGVCGSFDAKFLELPREALITSMREHQKYFPVAGKDGTLLPLFVAVNNTRVDNQELTVNGHQRVLRARLEDGLFFFRKDKERKLEDRRQDLAGIVFQKMLGSMLEKSERVAELARVLAGEIKPGSVDHAVRAAQLAKCDLLTEMVGEFPSLQGVMGRVYARLDGESEVVAVAIDEHYKPVRSGGEIPGHTVGAIVGMADRLDTLAGCFAIGEKPTGTTDPFGLRRLALGLLHIMKGHRLHVSLVSLVQKALAGYQGSVDMIENAEREVMDFIRLRFENDVIAAGIKAEVVTAATAVRFDDVVDCMARITALEAIRTREEFPVLAGSFKRIRNIIKDNRETVISEELLSDDAEKVLYGTLLTVKAEVAPFLEKWQYEEALATMLQMKEPLDRFFDDVMVMTDDAAVRTNRLNLLTSLGELVLQVGDISRMHHEETA